MTHLEKNIVDKYNRDCDTLNKVETKDWRLTESKFNEVTNRKRFLEDIIAESIISIKVLDFIFSKGMKMNGIYIDNKNEFSLHLSKGETKLTQSLKILKSICESGSLFL